MKKEMMIIAHEVTRITVNEIGGNYKATFGIVLKQLWNEVKAGRNYLAMVNMERYKNRIVDKFSADKKAQEEKILGIVEMHYSEYKNNYAFCKTVPNSYDKKAKTIKVYTNGSSEIKFGKYSNALCRTCGTYCYGDCTA